MKKRVDTPQEIYNRGKNILELLEKYSAFMPMVKDEDKGSLQEKITRLNDAKEKIKEEIYQEAKQRSGLDYAKKDKNPELLRKEYNKQIEEIKKRKQELRLDRIRIEKYNQQKTKQIEEQFVLASEKYKQMLESGKITQKLYDSRIDNMRSAKLKDTLDLSDKLHEIDEKYRSSDSEISEIKGKLEELNKNEIIYNELGDVYYNLFGEVMADRNKMEIEKETEPKENTKNIIAEDKTESVESTKPSGKSNVVNQPNNEDKSQENTSAEQPSLKADDMKVVEEQRNSKVVIADKKMFNELYKKMKKGYITEVELNALVETLENPNNYEKYGITTGIVFNKAKKILKFRGAKTAKNIEKFLRENAQFSKDIKFDPANEEGNIVSHSILTSWKDIDEKLTYTDAKFSVESYIEKMEKYKADGNLLTKEQETILSKALEIKSGLASYRKAINSNEEVTRERISRGSGLYSIFKGKIKEDSGRALPESRGRSDDRGFVVLEDLSSMVTEPSSADLKPGGKTNPTRIKDKEK